MTTHKRTGPADNGTGSGTQMGAGVGAIVRAIYDDLMLLWPRPWQLGSVLVLAVIVLAVVA